MGEACEETCGLSPVGSDPWPWAVGQLQSEEAHFRDSNPMSLP